MTSLLDPADWDDFRRHAHRLLDDMIVRLERAGEGVVWRPVPDAVKRRLAGPAPTTPQGVAETCRELGEVVLPYATGNTHPRFFGWVHGAGTPGGMLAEMTAAALNANCGGRDHGAIYLERGVVGWARAWFNFPDTAGGVLVTGSSMANLLALTAARNHKAGRDIREDGLGGVPMVGYTSVEAHACVAKAFEVLGLGRKALRRIPVDGDYRMDIDALRAAVAADRAAGLQPFCVVATAGTVTTGATDDLEAVAALCRAEDLWMHVDGAFGAVTVLSPTLKPRLRGIDQADSLAFDFHKWLHVPYDAGCVLLRDEAHLRAAFGGRPAYLTTGGGLAGGDLWPCDLGVELSRGFRALKVWFTIKEHGTDRLGAAIAANCAQAQLLAGHVAEQPRLRLMAPVALNIVCCRWEAPGLDAEAGDHLNKRIVERLHVSGVAVPSTCRLDGLLCIRVCILSHRTEDADLATLVEAIAAAAAAELASCDA